MWHKKKWIIISVVVAAVILVVGIVGGVAYAQTATPTAANSGKTLMGRVATILNIDQKKVEDAFAQAQKDMKNEAEKARLDKMVKDGKLTQDQADKYQSWENSRPDVPANLDIKPGAGPRGGMGFRGGLPCFPGMGAGPVPPGTPVK
jgi:uncharacterized membrane protein